MFHCRTQPQTIVHDQDDCTVYSKVIKELRSTHHQFEIWIETQRRDYVEYGMTSNRVSMNAPAGSTMYVQYTDLIIKKACFVGAYQQVNSPITIYVSTIFPEKRHIRKITKKYLRNKFKEINDNLSKRKICHINAMLVYLPRDIVLYAIVPYIEYVEKFSKKLVHFN